MLTKLRETISVKDYGAVGDGSTDDTAALQAAFSSGNSHVFLPRGTYYVTGNLVIPPQTCVYGLGQPLLSNPPSMGAIIMCQASLTGAAVTLGSTSAAVHLPACLENIAVVRQGGATSSIPAGTIGVQVVNSQAAYLNGVTSYGHDTGFYFRGNCPDGITGWMERCTTGRIQNTHLVIDSMPEVRVSNTRFGTNGVGDMVCQEFISVTGGSMNVAGGPNTLIFTNCQFNQGQNYAHSWMNFNNQMAGSLSDTGLLQFVNCYVETVLSGIVCDSTWTTIRRVQIANCELSDEGIQWFNLYPGTRLQDWAICNTIFYGNITINALFDHLLIDNVLVSDSFSLTSSDSSSTVMLANLSVRGSMNFAGPWADLIGSSIHGTFTNTATGNVLLSDAAGITLTAPYGVDAESNYTISYGPQGARISTVWQADGNLVVYNTAKSPVFSINATLGTVSIPSASVAKLPRGSTTPTGSMVYANNGCKPGEASGSGTGVPVFWNASTQTWYSFCSGAAVTS